MRFVSSDTKKPRPKGQQRFLWDDRSAMKVPSPSSSSSLSLSKLMIALCLLISLPYLFYSLRFSRCSSSSLSTSDPILRRHFSHLPRSSFGSSPATSKTTLRHVVFGIAASAKLWEKRKSYIRVWWRPEEMRGVVWLDKPAQNDVVEEEEDRLLPPRRISGDTSGFKYKNPKGQRSAIRISRIVSETLRTMETEGDEIRWLVMGDDDTVFFPDNLVRVLSKYDHTQFYYIGSSSESHLQNIYFSYNMAYGGGGFAISYGLAKTLEKIQDGCIKRYPGFYGSDDRIQACMAELGVPLTKEPGFHQFDVYGSVFGLLAAHPVAPLISLHHLDVVDPIFPNMSRVQALERLKLPTILDSAGLLQQSICYDKAHNWTVSVSWGYAVQIIRGVISARETEMPARTFLNWYKRSDRTGYSFNTRPVSRNMCQKPFVFYLANAVYNMNLSKTASEYVKHPGENPECRRKISYSDPDIVIQVVVYKKPNLHLWDKAPRRNCCRLLPTKNNGTTMVIDVGECGENEVVEIR